MLCQDGVELTGALMDLFLTLEQRGVALKQRLLEQGAPLLNPDDLQLFKLVIEEGDNTRLLSLSPQKSVVINGRFSLH